MVADRRNSLDALERPVRSGGFQHECTGRIRDQERVVIGPVGVDVAGSALTVPLDQVDDDPDGLFGRRAPLETQPDQVHAQEPRGRNRILGKDRVVADRDRVLVDPVLGTPEPMRTG